MTCQLKIQIDLHVTGGHRPDELDCVLQVLRLYIPDFNFLSVTWYKLMMGQVQIYKAIQQSITALDSLTIS